MLNNHARMPETWWRTLVALYAATDSNKCPARVSEVRPLFQVSMGTNSVDGLSIRLRRMDFHGLVIATQAHVEHSPWSYEMTPAGVELVELFDRCSRDGCLSQLYNRDYVPASGAPPVRSRGAPKKAVVEDSGQTISQMLASIIPYSRPPRLRAAHLYAGFIYEH